jgi:hypothetical protein
MREGCTASLVGPHVADDRPNFSYGTDVDSVFSCAWDLRHASVFLLGRSRGMVLIEPQFGSAGA